jgi:hypothetical protein
MVERRRLLLPYIEAGTRDLFRAQRGFERRLVVNVAARGGDEVRIRLHLAVLLLADQAAALVSQRAVDRNEIRLAHQRVEIDLLDAEPGHHLGAHIRVVGQDAHPEQAAAQFGKALADIAEPDDAHGLAEQVVPHEDVAVDDLAADRAVGLDDALREAEHHRERVLGDRLLVAAGLVEAEHAGLGAGLQVHGVVTRAVGRDDQQALRAAQQVGTRVILLRQFVARRAGLVGMRGGKDRRRDIVGAVIPELVETDVGALLDDLGEYRVGRTVDKKHALAAVGHEPNPSPKSL